MPVNKMVDTVFKIFFVSLFINVYAKEDLLEELKQDYINMLTECSQKHNLTPDDMHQLQHQKMPDNENAKCMFACAYRAAGMMDDQGMLSVENLIKISEKYFSEDPEKMKNAFQFTDACKTVNDQQVSDGEKGCERAALIFKCSVEQAPLFNFP